MSDNKLDVSKEIFWSRFADNFEKSNNYVVGEDEIKYVKEQLQNIGHFGYALELGCGDGVFSKSIVVNSDYLFATDWSDEMINAANHNLRDYNSIKVQKENCFNLSFDNNSFDTVIMANLLHIIPEPEKAIAEAKRVLKPNGKIVILSFTMHGVNILSKLGLLYRYFRTYGKPPKQSKTLTVADVEKMLKDKQFSIKYAKLIGIKMKSVLVIGENNVSRL